MSRRVARLSLALAIGIAPLMEAHAQDLRALAHEADVVSAMRDSTIAALARLQSAEAKARYSDTVLIAGRAAELLTNAALAGLVRQAATTADSFIANRFGNRVSMIPKSAFTVRVDTMRPNKPLIISKLTNGREGRMEVVEPNVRALALAVEEHIQQTVIDQRPTISRWLVAAIPMDTTSDDGWRLVRLGLATSATTVAARCYSGNIAACKIFLGLTPEPDPAVAWYDSATRRAIVRDAAKTGSLDGAASARCLAGNDADCVWLLRSSISLASWLDVPAHPVERAALLETAVAAGGRGALGAFLATDTLVVGLSAAAKMPIDSIVARWQRHMHDAAVRSDAFTPGIAVLSIGWILVLGGISTRSSRWR